MSCTCKPVFVEIVVVSPVVVPIKSWRRTIHVVVVVLITTSWAVVTLQQSKNQKQSWWHRFQEIHRQPSSSGKLFQLSSSIVAYVLLLDAWLKQDEEGVDICRHHTRHLVEVGRRKMERRSKVSILSQGSGCGYL